jgi:hypothetical protein
MFVPSSRQRSEIERTAALAASIMLELGEVAGPERRQLARAYLRDRCAGLGKAMRRMLSRDGDARYFKPFGNRPLTHRDLLVFVAQALTLCESWLRHRRDGDASPADEPAF